MPVFTGQHTGVAHGRAAAGGRQQGWIRARRRPIKTAGCSSNLHARSIRHMADYGVAPLRQSDGLQTDSNCDTTESDADQPIARGREPAPNALREAELLAQHGAAYWRARYSSLCRGRAAGSIPARFANAPEALDGWRDGSPSLCEAGFDSPSPMVRLLTARGAKPQVVHSEIRMGFRMA